MRLSTLKTSRIFPPLATRTSATGLTSRGGFSLSRSPLPRRRHRHRVSHIEDDLLGDFPVPHLENVNQPHFDPGPDREIKIPVLCHLECEDGVVHNPVLRCESLDRLELHVAHCVPKPAIVVPRGFLP